MKAVIVLILCSLGISSNAYAKAQYTLEIVPTNGQTENWQNGLQSVDDAKVGSTVRLVSSQDALPDKQSTFRVFVLNKSDKPVLFGLENITIEGPKGAVAQIASREELVAKLRRDIKRRQALAALGGAFSAQGADGRTTGSFDYSGISTRGGLVSGSGTYTAYDPVLAQQQQAAADEQSAAVARAISGRQLSGNHALDSVIRKSTIQPGGIIGGVVPYTPLSSFKRLSKNDQITIVITVGDVQHRIGAKIVPVR